MTVRVGVLGAHGRMGTAACQIIDLADDLEVVAAIGSADSLEALVTERAEVVVDLTRPEAVMTNVAFAVDHGMHVVVGTSGIDADRLDAISRSLEKAAGVGVIVVANFAVGAVLMMRFAEVAAPFFESVEIVERHHPDKVDAPSGTARRTAELLSAARAEAGLGPAPDATAAAPAGARGADVSGIPVHSVRARGLVAHQEVLFGSSGETLTIRHDSIDRSSFMPGVLLAVREVGSRPGLTVGLEPLLGLP